MAITEEIDLTLESDFASAYDKWLKPERARLREDSDVLGGDLIIDDFFRHISASAQFFPDGKVEERVIQETIDFYFYLFGNSPAFMARLTELDPYAAYFWGYGITCDCCGKELSILNSDGYSLCVGCRFREAKGMEIN